MFSSISKRVATAVTVGFITAGQDCLASESGSHAQRAKISPTKEVNSGALDDASNGVSVPGRHGFDAIFRFSLPAIGFNDKIAIGVGIFFLLFAFFVWSFHHTFSRCEALIAEAEAKLENDSEDGDAQCKIDDNHNDPDAQFECQQPSDDSTPSESDDLKTKKDNYNNILEVLNSENLKWEKLNDFKSMSCMDVLALIGFYAILPFVVCIVGQLFFCVATEGGSLQVQFEMIDCTCRIIHMFLECCTMTSRDQGQDRRVSGSAVTRWSGNSGFSESDPDESDSD